MEIRSTKHEIRKFKGRYSRPTRAKWRLAKWRLVRNLYDLGYNAEEVREIFRLIEWMMNLREDLNRKFEA